MRAADAVVAVSRCVAHHLWQRLSLDNVEVIYNWVDTDLFKPEKMIARGDGPFRLLFVGKPTRLKGGDMLVPLMRELGAAFELRLTAELQDCRNMNLPANIIPMGRLSEQDMVKAYQQCDALLLPSRAEGFSYAALEAMACGKPVITALPESVTDGITGVLCRIGEVHDFVEACRSLAANQVQCGEIGLKSRQGTVEKFSESEAMDRYIPLIKHLV